MSAPVKLTCHGRARVYIVPAETFERLMALEDAELVRRADAARKRGMIGPEASMALLKGLTDASRKPVARGGESSASRSREAPPAAGKQAARTTRTPAPSDAKKLVGSSCWRVTVGEYRVVYDITADVIDVVLLEKRDTA